MNYTKVLKVSTPEGVRVPAIITRTRDRIIVNVPYLKVVEDYDPTFTDGVIHFAVEQKNYQETIQKLEKYLEDLFLKGMADEDFHSSIGIGSKSRGAKGKHSRRKTEGETGQGSLPGIYSGSRGGKPPKSDRGGSAETDMAESSDSDSEPEDSSGA